MKYIFTCLGVLVVALFAEVHAQPTRNPLDHIREERDSEPLPDARFLMRQVRSQLPGMPLKMKGFIRTRTEEGTRDRGLVSTLRFGDPVPKATFEVSDRFGEPLNRLQVRWPRGVPEYSLQDGNGKSLPAPAPDVEVAGTGLSASDLALGFLWWPDAKVEGRDRIRARPAWIVVLNAPDHVDAADRVKLWVDRKALFIVRADLLDAEGNLLKKIEVDSIKEIREDFWIVKDLLIRDKANDRRIGIRFEEVEELDPPQE